jgi:two-component system response regulator PilR (NtrC family)
MVEKQYSILVVDDELSMRELLEYMLEKKGYRVVCAANGKEALSKIKKEHYDLLLCDIRLGDMTGLEVLKASKKINPHVTVIMISAFATTETAVEAMNQGAFDYVPKPFENQELLQTIANALERKTLEKDKRAIDNELKGERPFRQDRWQQPAHAPYLRNDSTGCQNKIQCFNHGRERHRKRVDRQGHSRTKRPPGISRL